MQAEQILRADLLDIIFEGRNKAYGAYELRKTYNRRIKYAMAVMMAVCLLFLIGMWLVSAAKKNAVAPPFVKDVVLIGPPAKERNQVIVEPPKPKLAEIKTIKFTAPKIVTKNVDKDIPPPQDALKDITIATITKDGKNFGDVVLPPVENTTTVGIKLKNNDRVSITTFIPVQFEAKFPGGTNAWERFLQTNLNTSIPVDNGAPPGRYTVTVSFSVDHEGNISEVQALNDPGYGTAGEAVRVLKKSRQWIPAMQNGRNVSYRQKQKITFIVNEN